MSCAPNRTAREQRMLRAIKHAIYREHPYDVDCAGCLEVVSFATQKGYEGNTDNPVCGTEHDHEAEDEPAPWPERRQCYRGYRHLPHMWGSVLCYGVI